jgi:hypothetical protein
MGDGDKWTEIVWGEEKYFVQGQTRAAKAEQRSFAPQEEPIEPTKEGLLSDVPKGVGPSTTLAWPGWKQPDIPVEVDTGRLETDVGRQEF